MTNNTVLTILIQNKWLPFELLFINKELNDLVPKTFYLNKNNYKLLSKIKNIKNIICDEEFDKEIIFPEGIESINLGYGIKHKIPLPNSLKYFTYYSNINVYFAFVFTKEDYLKYPLTFLIPENVEIICQNFSKYRMILPNNLNNYNKKHFYKTERINSVNKIVNSYLPYADDSDYESDS
jgi:hypothetical protein